MPTQTRWATLHPYRRMLQSRTCSHARLGVDGLLGGVHGPLRDVGLPSGTWHSADTDACSIRRDVRSDSRHPAICPGETRLRDIRWRRGVRRGHTHGALPVIRIETMNKASKINRTAAMASDNSPVENAYGSKSKKGRMHTNPTAPKKRMDRASRAVTYERYSSLPKR